MSILSVIYIASPEQAIDYDTSPNLPASERLELRGLTYLELSELWAILEGTPWTPEHQKAFKNLLTVGGGTRLINCFPPEFVELLASLDEAGAAKAADAWARTGELAFLSCEPSDVLPIIDAASRLAQRTKQTGKQMYLWMCV